MNVDVKQLVNEFPFLLPRNVWTDKLDDDYDYSYCRFVNEIPHGWWDRWGLTYLKDLKEVLEKYNFLDKFRFSEIKEKYGGLRAYNFGQPEEWDSHEHAWEYISEHTCIECGKFPVPMRHFSWISPYCDEHAWSGRNWTNEEKETITEKDWDGRMLEYLVINHFSKDGDYQELIDMKPYYDKVGWKYTDKDLILKDEIEKNLEERDGKKSNKE